MESKSPEPRYSAPKLGHKRPRSTASLEDHHGAHLLKVRKTATEEPTNIVAIAPTSESSLVAELTMAAQNFCMATLSDQLPTCILAKLEAALSVARTVNALSREALFPCELHRYRLLKEAANYLMGASHHARAFDIYMYLYALASRQSRSDLKVEYMFACMRSADDPSQFQQVAEMIRNDLGFHTSLCHMVMAHMTYANTFASDELAEPLLKDPSRLAAVRVRQEAPIDESVCLDTAKLFNYSYLIRGAQEPSWKGFVDFVSRTNGTLPGGSAAGLLEDLVAGLRSGLAGCRMALQADPAVPTLAACAAALSASSELTFAPATPEHRLACVFVYLFEALAGAGAPLAESPGFSRWINTAHRMGFGHMAFLSVICEMLVSRPPAAATTGRPSPTNDDLAALCAGQAAALAALPDRGLADRFVDAFVRRENRSHALEAFLPAPSPDVAQRLHRLQARLGLLKPRVAAVAARPAVLLPPRTPPPRFDDDEDDINDTISPALVAPPTLIPDTPSSSSLRRLAGRASGLLLLPHKPRDAAAAEAPATSRGASLASVSDLSQRLRDSLSLGGPPALPMTTGPARPPPGLGRPGAVVGGLFPSAMPALPERRLGADWLGR